MCGIGGKVVFGGRPDERVAKRMTECMSHRGPNAQGIYATGPAVLAHRRLSILDTSVAGNQPMSNQGGDVHIVFNGEIYNYRELRERVGNYSFTSETDTEVLLAMYEEYGVDCLQYLRGMFAFAIWDESEERLFVARDRLGQKPLFYKRDGKSFIFGSTIGAILADDTVSPQPDQQAIRSYLRYQFVPSPRTGFEDIRQLSPGEYITVDTDGFTRDRYWSLSFADQRTATPDTLASQLREKLREATRLRMRSDVPLGLFLSGGLDSSVVAALMSDLSDDPINTYSIGFDVDRYDELGFAQTVAEEFGTNHTTHTLSADTMVDSVSELLDHYQMPLGDTSILPTYHVSRLASDDITVALTGDAGDETLAGYPRYHRDRMVTQLARLPKPLQTLGHTALDMIPAPFSSHRYVRWPTRALDVASEDAASRYAAFICDSTAQEVATIRTEPPSAHDCQELRSLLAVSDGPTRTDQLLDADLKLNLPDRLLVKVDRASMANSLEVRSPFLDHEFVEFTAKIPAKYKLNGCEGKWLLKRAFEDVLPAKILNRSKKGFGVPIDTWIRGELRELATESLSRLGDRPYFQAARVSQLLDSHVEKQENNGNRIWNLIVLEQWYERYIDEGTD